MATATASVDATNRDQTADGIRFRSIAWLVTAGRA